jgi:tetratricopeptide (TPR) repeat protein
LQARKALARLTEFATHALLAGICQGKHPALEVDLSKYGAEERKTRDAAISSQAFAERYEILAKLAASHPELALARHEAGLAALLAGHAAPAREHLLAALAISEASLTRLGLAQAELRLGGFEAAESHLAKARAGLDERLLPDYDLLRGRLLAARGDIAGASRTLSEANARWPRHEQLAAFAQSAQELCAPSLDVVIAQGPLGLTLLSDLDAMTLNRLLDRLKPYIERLKSWLPDSRAGLEGSIAIYAGPTDYLRAALLVAGDGLDNVAGMFLGAGIGGKHSVIACRVFGEEELLRTLVHELWHLAVSQTPGGAQLPAWLNEGMAVYLSAADLTRDRTLTFNALPSEFARLKKELDGALGDTKASKDAFEASRGQFYAPGKQRLNYALAWAMVWYLAQSDMASERILRELMADKGKARQEFTTGLNNWLGKARKALKDSKIL